MVSKEKSREYQATSRQRKLQAEKMQRLQALLDAGYSIELRKVGDRYQTVIHGSPYQFEPSESVVVPELGFIQGTPINWADVL